jgi:hypothetical protein
MPKDSMGLLNESQFKYTSLDTPGSKNIPPLSIHVQIFLFGTFINITLNQLQGASSNSSINTNMYSIYGTYTNMSKMDTEKLVGKFFN